MKRVRLCMGKGWWQLEVSGKSHIHPCYRRKIGRDQCILNHFPLSFETHVESDGG